MSEETAVQEVEVEQEAEVKRMESTALSWPERAASIVVADQESYDAACELVTEISSLEKQIQDHHKPIKESAYRAHRAACEAEKKLLDPLAEAKGIIKKSLGTWMQEQESLRLEAERKAALEAQRIQAEMEAKQREAQRIAEEKARKIDEEQKLRLAEEAEAAGASEETIAEILDAPAPAPVYVPPVAPIPVVVPAVVPTFRKAKGVSTSQRWSAQVMDIKALCRAVADGTASTECVQPNMTALNSMARAMKSTMNIPGVRAVADTTVSVKKAV